MGSINFTLQNNPSITFISGSNGPSGNINLENFPNLTGFGWFNSSIIQITGLNNCSGLRLFIVTQSLTPSSSRLVYIPDISNNLHLNNFNIARNRSTGFFPNISINTGLIFFDCSANQITGSISNLPNLISGFSCASNNLDGSIPDLSLCTNLTGFNCGNNLISGYNGTGVTNRLGNFLANSNILQPSSVNLILANFVTANKTAGQRILNLGGAGNFAPTGQGITDVDTLRSRGWTVTTGVL